MLDCTIHWARLTDLEPRHHALLDATERARRDAYLREPDRQRFTLAAVILRLLAGPGQEIDRTCPDCGEPHGRPRLTGTATHVSVTHSGKIAAVALAPAPVGIDVEAVREFDHAPLHADVLAATESAHDAAAFFAYWTRKESALKATGQGLQLPMNRLRVSAPHEPPRLLAYDGEALDAQMADLQLDPGYAAAATVLTAQPAAFTLRHAGELLKY